MTKICPSCGVSISGSDPGPEPCAEAMEGFAAGRKGRPNVVPADYERLLPKAGLWKHGWRLGDAVRRQVEDVE